jgi:hypothetical protein
MTHNIRVEWVNGNAPSDDKATLEMLIEEQLLFKPTNDTNCYNVVYQDKTFIAKLHTGNDE